MSSVRHRKRDSRTEYQQEKKRLHTLSPLFLQPMMTGSYYHGNSITPNCTYIYIHIFIYLFLYLVCTGPLAIRDHEKATDEQTHSGEHEDDTSSCLDGIHQGNHSFYVQCKRAGVNACNGYEYVYFHMMCIWAPPGFQS